VQSTAGESLAALAAVVFGEPGADEVARRLDGAAVFAPDLLAFELASVARKKLRRHPERAEEILRALWAALDPRRARSCCWPFGRD